MGPEKLDAVAATPSPRRGRDIEFEVDLTLEEAYHGADRLLEIDGHRIQAVIPPGVRTGSRFRLSGLGETGQNSEPAGVLYLFIHASQTMRLARYREEYYEATWIELEYVDDEE